MVQCITFSDPWQRPTPMGFLFAPLQMMLCTYIHTSQVHYRIHVHHLIRSGITLEISSFFPWNFICGAHISNVCISTHSGGTRIGAFMQTLILMFLRISFESSIKYHEDMSSCVNSTKQLILVEAMTWWTRKQPYPESTLTNFHYTIGCRRMSKHWWQNNQYCTWLWVDAF